jgi:uncharacterized protein YggE
MKHKIMYLVLSGLLALVLVGCSSTGAQVDAPQAPASISVSGSGTATASPDQVTLQLGVETVSQDPTEAISENSQRMNAIMAVMADMQIPAEKIQTVNYAMWVEDVYDANGPTGEKRYHLSNQVSVQLDQLDQTGALLEKATSAGANSIGGITFGVSDTSELQQSALDKAMADARQKAERLAADLNMQVGEVRSVIEGVQAASSTPMYAQAAIGGGGGVPVSSGQFSLVAQVQVVFDLVP